MSFALGKLGLTIHFKKARFDFSFPFLQAWQSKYFVLRNKTQNLSQRLEYYKDENAFELQKPVEYSFYLDSIVYIGETHSSKSHCYPIMIVCSKQGAITLACDTEKVTKDWLEAINKVVVKVGGTSSSEIWAHVPNGDSPSSTPELQRRATSDLSSVPSKSWHNLGPNPSQGKAKTAIPPGWYEGFFWYFLANIQDVFLVLNSALRMLQYQNSIGPLRIPIICGTMKFHVVNPRISALLIADKDIILYIRPQM